MDETINQLLNEVKQISEESKKIAKLRGENFNIFQVLKFSRDEVRLHSRLIKVLLNPKGKHEKRELFLRLFLETLYDNNIKVISPITQNLYDTDVKAEMDIGNLKKEEGGRIDIYLGNSEFKIAIENKIDAIDQDGQLIRYHNFLNQSNENAILLLYLTLEGKSPSNKSISIGGKKLKKTDDFYCISYSKHILEWLNKCHEKTHDEPILRETIKQYIILIKKLTGKISNEMDKKLKNKILENFQEAKLIRDNFDEAVLEYMKKNTFDELKSKLEKKNWNCIEHSKMILRISRKTWRDKIWIQLEFLNNYSRFNYGLRIGADDARNGVWNNEKIAEEFNAKKAGSFFIAKNRNFNFLDTEKKNTTHEFNQLIDEIINQIEEDEKLVEKINREAYNG